MKERIAHSKGYRVTRNGVVLSRRGARKCSFNTSRDVPYKKFNIRIDGKNTNIKVHRLQAFQKYGDKIYEDYMVVRHLDGDSLNNSWDNIAIGTRSQNMMDIPAESRKDKAMHATSFVRKHDKATIIEYYSKCGSYAKTMQKFGITSKGTLWFVLNK